MLVFILLGFAVKAQMGEMQLHIGVSGAMPTGSFKDNFQDASARGWKVGVLYGITDKISAGLQVGFQDFYQKIDRKIYTTENGNMSAVLTNSLQTIPILISGRYIFNNESTIQAFGGLGIGGNIVSYSEYYGQFGGSDTKVKFAVKPELGLSVPFGRFKDNSVWVSAAYNYMPYNEFEIKNLNHLSVMAGVKIPMRR